MKKLILIAIAAIVILSSCKKERIEGPAAVQPFGDYHRWPTYWQPDSKQ